MGNDGPLVAYFFMHFEKNLFFFGGPLACDDAGIEMIVVTRHRRKDTATDIVYQFDPLSRILAPLFALYLPTSSLLALPVTILKSYLTMMSTLSSQAL